MQPSKHKYNRIYGRKSEKLDRTLCPVMEEPDKQYQWIKKMNDDHIGECVLNSHRKHIVDVEDPKVILSMYSQKINKCFRATG